LKAKSSAPPRRTPQWRSHVVYPGRLATVIAERIIELERGTFSIYAIELVCYDLRKRRKHSITGSLFQQSLEVQDAVDRQIIRNYRPLMPRRRGEFIRSLVEDTILAYVAPDSSDGLVSKEYEWVLFPPLLREIIGLRWRELGFSGISQYVTSVIRYDLLLGGPHNFFRGGDCTPEMCRSLDLETIRLFHLNYQPRILADYLVEKGAGRKLTREECDAELRAVGEKLMHRAVEARKSTRH
jgi:hypothetical protein